MCHRILILIFKAKFPNYKWETQVGIFSYHVVNHEMKFVDD